MTALLAMCVKGTWGGGGERRAVKFGGCSACCCAPKYKVKGWDDSAYETCCYKSFLINVFVGYHSAVDLTTFKPII